MTKTSKVSKKGTTVTKTVTKTRKKMKVATLAANTIGNRTKVRGSKVVVYFRGVQTVGTVTRRRTDRGGIYYIDVNTDAGIEHTAYAASQVAFLK